MNTTIIIGNLTDKPLDRQTNGGTRLCTFDVAVSMGKDRTPLYVSVTVWNDKLREYCNQYLEKGSKVCIVGRLDYPYAYKSEKTGEAKCCLKIRADQVEFLPKGLRNEPAQPLPQNIPATASNSGYPQQGGYTPPGFSEVDPNDVPWFGGNPY